MLFIFWLSDYIKYSSVLLVLITDLLDINYSIYFRNHSVNVKCTELSAKVAVLKTEQTKLVQKIKELNTTVNNLKGNITDLNTKLSIIINKLAKYTTQTTTTGQNSVVRKKELTVIF